VDFKSALGCFCLTTRAETTLLILLSESARFGRFRLLFPESPPEACWEHGLPYRLETTWGPGVRRFRRMVFSMREISVLLDHYAPPVNQVLDAAATSPRSRSASHDEKTADARR
jgi:hypothetical protein